MNVVYRHAMALAEAGVQVSLVHPEVPTPDDVRWHPIRSWMDRANPRWLSMEAASAERFDIAVCTWWETLFDLPKLDAGAYVYFVQSIESRFYPEEERVTRVAVEATYRSGVGIVTEAHRIAGYLLDTHGQQASIASNGIDKSIYREDGERIAPRTPGRLRVLVEGAADVWFKNVPTSVRLAREGGADEVWLLTTSDIDALPGADRVFSRVPQEATAPIYRSCDLVLKLSLVEGMFGPPLEMFHCGGTAIVYDVTGHDEYIRDGYNAMVARSGDEGDVRHLVASLRGDPAALDRLKANARETAAAWPDWPESGRQFHAGLLAAAERSSAGRIELRRLADVARDFLNAHWIEMELHGNGQLRQTHERAMEALRDELNLDPVREELYERIRRHQALEAELQTILGSKSWRVTAPLRALTGLLHRARQ